MKKPKSERKRDREILAAYQRYLTEKELDPLFEHFKQWKAEKLSYDDLTEYIHEFHQKNQKIWSMFNDGLDEEYLIFRAKKELDMFNAKDLENEWYQHWLR
jgi:succinate dehydrogenase flavin-adding protein (antitoxin of CptAB toxin-antitoxin module)